MSTESLIAGLSTVTFLTVLLGVLVVVARPRAGDSRKHGTP